MSFFNKKEEVIDIQLTQFGKHLLSVGEFKPVFYRFFDDNILYNSNHANFAEHQNSIEDRILTETPTIKPSSLTMGVQTAFKDETLMINNDARGISNLEELRQDRYVQDRLLLYPLANQEARRQEAPVFYLASHGQDFEPGVEFLHLTGAGIQKKIPQITVNPKYTVFEDRSDPRSPRMINNESFFDLSEDEIVFADNTKLRTVKSNLIIDLEELNVFYGLDNFEVEIYEIIDDTGPGEKEKLIRIQDLNKINELFTIKTDEDVETVDIKTGKSSNYYRRGEKT